MTDGDKRCDFFISYTSADAAWAQWIADVVERAGYSVVLQARDFLSGGNFVLDMDAAVGCERTIAVISPAYFESDYVKAEWAAAFREDPTGEKSKLIPVRVADFAPGGLLGSIVYIDLVGLSEEEAAVKVVEEIAAILAGRRMPKGGPDLPRRAERRRRASLSGHPAPGMEPSRAPTPLLRSHRTPPQATGAPRCSS